MLNSRKIEDLRYDVRANCLVFLDLCREAGLNVLVCQTLRDDEYQKTLYEKGYSKGAYTTFHGEGLAFDICKNVKGHEYDDLNFFNCCGQIGKQVGFTWGGDWTSFPDKPHLQWDDHKRFTNAMIRSGRVPGEMPDYREGNMTGEQIYKELSSYLSKQPVPAWAAKELSEAKAAGITDGSDMTQLIPRYQAVLMAYRASKK